MRRWRPSPPTTSHVGLLTFTDMIRLSEVRALANNPDCIVATPGRLQHILLDAQLSLSRVEYVVFDEVLSSN